MEDINITNSSLLEIIRYANDNFDQYFKRINQALIEYKINGFEIDEMYLYSENIIAFQAYIKQDNGTKNMPISCVITSNVLVADEFEIMYDYGLVLTEMCNVFMTNDIEDFIKTFILKLQGNDV